ncbi:putative ubiquitin conjugating [Diplodia seriata]|uniref:Putative ubiquitin conjugating n=1 Tax=Diplodia seriata TaxID=420778 RepID=A0A0G2E7E2_9PEZI|nr:putative ubiquitin conjugating [Diplodia seriata]
MPAHTICVEDTVHLKAKQWLIGVVDPPRRTVLVSWQTDFTTELVPEEELELVDRNFFVGDVVKRDANSPMSGTVIGTKLAVTIAPIRMWPEVDAIRAHSYEKLIGDDTTHAPRSLIPAEELETIRQYPEGALIIYDDWVGRIDDAYDEIALRLSNGTVVVPESSDELTPVDPRLERHEVGDYVKTKKGNLRRGRVRFKDLTGACVKYAPYVKKRPRVETLGYDTNIYTVQTTRTTVITQWQDLSITEDESIGLLPDPNVDDEDEVWPGEVVCTNERKPKDASTGGSGEQEEWYIEPARVGVVQAVEGKDRMAMVKWFPDATIKFVENDLLPGSKTGIASGPEEKVSLYDIRTTASLNRRRGDYVIAVESSLAGAQNLSDDIDWFGEVVDLGLDGQLTVRLGAANPVRDIKVPSEGVILAYSADLDPDNVPHDHLGDSMSEDEAYDDDMDDESLLDDEDNYLNMWYEYTDPDGRRIRVEDDNDDDEEGWATEEEDEIDQSSAEDNDVSMEDAAAVDTSKTTPEAQPSAHPLEGAAATDGASDNKTSEPFSFSNYPDAPAAFEILEDAPPQDHHFIRAAQGESTQQRLRRIQKEHKILGSSLPPGILVRTWESRMDLLRVLIVGPEDTPYEYAPFLVDFHLGPNFPSSPPEAFFHSWTGGMGPVNPNLYEDGKICLSLLGTWHADERNENWSQAKSTILQVLVSLMGLVLVREPYYNEAGYEVRQGTEETSLSSALYSEKAYFRARGFIMHGLTHLPAPFEEDVQWLYRKEKGPKLLEKAIEAAKGIIGRSEGGSAEKRDGLRNISAGAIIPLKRQLAGLERLQQSDGQQSKP